MATREEFVDAMEDFAGAAGRLTTQLSNDRRWRRRLVVAVVVVGVLLLGNLMAFWWVAKTVTDNQDTLIECTIPSTGDDRHECYDRGQARTADAVEQIRNDGIRTDAATFQCVIVDRRPDLLACIQERLAGQP